MHTTHPATGHFRALEDARRKLADAYAGLGCTLDDRPAKICGRLEPFATVATLDGERAAQFAWGTVALVMNHHKGHFRS